jgi:cobalt-zinc-cadmium efflux system outer membrane protein
MKEKIIFMLVAATMIFAVRGCSTPPESGSLKGEAFGDGNHPTAVEPDVGEMSHASREESISLGENPMLSDYLRYAALNNAGLKAAFEQWKVAVEQVPQVKSLPDPEFTYGYVIEEVETMPGPRSQKLQLMQVFPWIGTIEARTDAAASSAMAAKKRYEAAKLQLFFEVKEAFFEYVYLASAVEIAKENLELTKHFEEVARARYTTSAATHPDIILSQVELAKMENELRTLEEMRTPISARLSAILNRKDAGLLPWPQKADLRAITLDHRKLAETLKANNPELQALDFDLESAKSRIELAKKRFYPDVGVGVEWLTNAGMMDAELRDSQRDEVMLMFGMNLPIWRKSYKAGELEARMDRVRMLQEKKETENTLVARAAQVLYDFENSDRILRLYRDVLVPKAQELLGASETAYKAGTIDFLSLVNAQQKLLEFQLQYERAAADNQQKLAELEMLVGSEL